MTAILAPANALRPAPRPRAAPARSAGASGAATDAAAAATALMDRFRRLRAAEDFERLIALTGPHLRQRAQLRLRQAGLRLDPQEVLQDVILNIYRYPDRFLADRAGAFAAWSAAIVDNAVRRRLRTRRAAQVLPASEWLEQHAPAGGPGPADEAEARESWAAACSAYPLLLAVYLAAFERLSPREQLVLHQVEVGGQRYQEVAAALAVRADAVKMVVFRARRRMLERMRHLLAGRSDD